MKNIENFYSDYGSPPEFLTSQYENLLKGNEFKTPKGIQRYAETNIPFQIKDDWVSDIKLNILMAHFKPFKNEFDALDYPMFLSKIWPNSNIHLTYDKSSNTYPPSFTIKDGEIKQIDSILPSYDIIIGRSSVLSVMGNRPKTSKVPSRSKFKVQLRSMGYHHNTVGYDLVFKDDYVSPPPSPVYRENAIQVLNNTKKEKIILFAGSLSGWKNQESFIKMLDPDLCKDFSFLFLGEGPKAREVSQLCKEKRFRHYMGWANHAYMPFFTSISCLNVNNTDSRAWGQPYDPNPRVLGESTVSNTHSICSKLTLFNDDLKNYVTSYDHEDSSSLNKVFEQSLKLDCSTYNQEFKTLEQKCYEITQAILNEFLK
jgi:glycosyltransferase involved in cell wall biosynthesis